MAQTDDFDLLNPAGGVIAPLGHSGDLDTFPIQLAADAGISINVSDTDSKSEHVQVLLSGGVAVTVFDVDNPNEQVIVRIPMRITVFDADAPAESVTVRLSGASVSVFDTVVPSEAVTVRIPMAINVSDDAPAAEDVRILRNPLLINVADGGASIEDVRILRNPLLLSVADTDTPAESVSHLFSLAINIADRDIVEDTDQATVKIPLKIVILTPDPPSEQVNVTLGRQITVFDQRHGSESVSLAQSLRINVSDSDTPTEFVSLTSVAPRAVSVVDTVTPTEHVRLAMNPVIAVHDGPAPGEHVRLLVGFTGPSVFDTALPSESVRLLMSRLAINVFDADPPTDHAQLPFEIAAPPPTPASGGYAPTWLFDARQLVGTGMEPLELMFASRDIEGLDPPYRGRIIEEPTVTRKLMDTFWGLTEVSEITVKIANHDRRLVLLYRADPRDQPVVLRRFDARTLEVTDELYARITDVALETGAISISAASPQLGVFEREMPGPLVTDQQFPTAVDLGVVIPVVFGNVTKMPMPYVSRDAANLAFDYLAGHGALTVSAVYSVRADGGYTLIPATEYVVSTQAYTGLTIVRFATRRVDAEGRDVPIVADISGASRNVIRNIQSLLSDPVWGLKQPIHQAGFDAAAAQIDALGLLCDGALREQRQAQDVLRELMLVRGIRLTFTEQGEWTVTIDTPKTAIELVLRDGPGDGGRTILSVGKRERPETADVISVYTLAYKEDFLRGEYQFRQQRTVNPNHGRERTIENAFIRDHATADKTIDYLAKRERFGAERVDLTIPQEGRRLKEGDLIEVSYAPMAMTAAVMEVREVIKRLQTVSVLAAGWDEEIYTYTPGTLPFDPSEFTGTITVPPVGGLTVVLTACDFVVTWQPVSEVLVGEDEDNLIPIAVKDYQVEVYVDGFLMRTEYVTTTSYTYTLVKNKIDNPPLGSRNVTFVVRARTFDGVLGGPNSGGGTVPTPSMATIAINVFDDSTTTVEGDSGFFTTTAVREYVALSRGPIEVRDTVAPTESVALTISARRISVTSQIDGSSGSMRTGHDFVTIELNRRAINVAEEPYDPYGMDDVQLQLGFGPGRAIVVYDDAQPEADFMEDGIVSNIRSSVVAINVNDKPGAFGVGVTEFRLVKRSTRVNVSDTRTTTESVTVVTS